MTWERKNRPTREPRAHRCRPPILALALSPMLDIKPGDVWRCDSCGTRHMVARRDDGGLHYREIAPPTDRVELCAVVDPIQADRRCWKERGHRGLHEHTEGGFVFTWEGGTR